MSRPDGLRPGAANPWDCAGSERALPGPEPGRASSLLRALARLLHGWPDETPVRLRSEERRLRRLVETIAGYPLIAPGSLPLDQPLHERAGEALELTLALDAWPPLAGHHGLRAELLWLDQVRRGGAESGAGPADWLDLTLGWLLAGLAAPQDEEPGTGVVLFDVLFDPEEREGRARTAARLAARLAALRRQMSVTGRLPGDFGRGPDARVDRLWGGRHAAALRVGRQETPWTPTAALPASAWATEVRFHRVQSWLVQREDATSADRQMLGPPLRGASDLLEATLSALRRVLLERLGPGSLLIDGGARLCVRAPADAAARRALEGLVHAAIDRLFWRRSTVGRRFAGVLARLRPHLGPLPDDPRAQRRHVRRCLAQLAWTALPPLSVTSEEWPQRGPRMPLRRRWRRVRFPPLSPAEPGDSIRRDRRPMSLPTRLRTEIGVQAPRDRLLRIRLRDTGGDAPRLPGATAPFQQLLVADLNQVGRLFLRHRGARLRAVTGPARGLHLEAVARRSLRFTAHWLLAVTRTAVELDDPTLMAEILVLAGDDLVVGTRLPEADLLRFGTRLQANLAPLNAELPEAEPLSFCAGLARRPREGPGHDLLFEAMRLERLAKQRWKWRVLGVGTPPALDPAVTIYEPGEGRASPTILSAPAGTVPRLAIDDPEAVEDAQHVVPLDAIPEDGAALLELLARRLGTAMGEAEWRGEVVEVVGGGVEVRVFAPRPADGEPGDDCTCSEHA